MADRIKGKSAKASLVFHDGTSMVVINQGKPYDVDASFEQKLVDAGVIDADPAKAAKDVQPVKADGGMQTGGADEKPAEGDKAP